MRQESAAVVEARALQARGRSREACARLLAVVQSDPSDPARLPLLNFLLQDGRAHEALALIREHDRSWADDLRILNLRAFAEHQLGRYAEAQRSYERIRELGSGNEGWLRIADNGLASLARERELRERAENSRMRAGLLTGAGALGLLLMCGASWVMARRMEKVRPERGTSSSSVRC